MRVVLLVIAVAMLLLNSGGLTRPARTAAAAASPSALSVFTPKARVDFDSQLEPIFKSKCMPCHFSGGKVYDRLPFDKPETIRKLGAKLFTRIKDENDRRLIEDFLSQSP